MLHVFSTHVFGNTQVLPVPVHWFAAWHCAPPTLHVPCPQLESVWQFCWLFEQRPPQSLLIWHCWLLFEHLPPQSLPWKHVPPVFEQVPGRHWFDAHDWLPVHAWPALDPYLARGGVIIVIEGADRTGHLFAAGAHLYQTAAPLDVTGQAMMLAAPTDTVADQVLAPYLGEATTVSFPGIADPVVATLGGATVVFHRVR